ncbi:MAG: hypothetical protein BWY78_00329 [Alphaproteobacteria bacterium ADurb.Bin438]|nr:MAG: hypothetical protein BWY78_00329 [Alphaproteobacteria bacterium ADurb.Bin438]
MVDTKRFCRLVSLQEGMYSYLEPELKKRGVNSFTLFYMWEEILGKELSQNIYFVRISEARNNKRTLHLATFSDAYALELSYKKDMIIKRINTTLGIGFISDIKLMVSDFEQFKPISSRLGEKKVIKNLDQKDKKELNVEIEKIKNEDLKNALYNLKALIDGVN